MKVVHISTHDIRGGAPRSAYRLHQGLMKAGVDSKMLVQRKWSDDSEVVQYEPTPEEASDLSTQRLVDSGYQAGNRTSLSNTLFSFSLAGCDISKHPVIQEADVVHLHWVNEFLSPVSVAKLLESGKRCVWTFHDQWAFTGGCHYTSGSTGYLHACEECPQLKSDPLGLVPGNFELKRQLFSDGSIRVICPSQWMAGCARESVIFGKSEVSVVPYGLDTEVFSPGDVAANRKAMGLGSDEFVILFGGESDQELRKGFEDLRFALARCRQSPEFSKMLNSGAVRLMQFGRADGEASAFGLPVLSVGHLEDDEQLACCYSAADVMLSTSHEDNLPNTVLESFSCGTPVIGYNIGGMPDIVEDGATGFLVENGDRESVAEKLLQMVEDRSLGAEMSGRCREVSVARYSLEGQATRAVELYERMIAQPQEPHRIPVEVLQKRDSYWARAVSRTLPSHIDGLNSRIEMIENDRAARLTVIEEAHHELHVRGELIARLKGNAPPLSDDYVKKTGEVLDEAAEGTSAESLKEKVKELRQRLVLKEKALSVIKADRAEINERFQVSVENAGRSIAEANGLQHKINCISDSMALLQEENRRFKQIVDSPYWKLYYRLCPYADRVREWIAGLERKLRGGSFRRSVGERLTQESQGGFERGLALGKQFSAPSDQEKLRVLFRLGGKWRRVLVLGGTSANWQAAYVLREVCDEVLMLGCVAAVNNQQFGTLQTVSGSLDDFLIHKADNLQRYGAILISPGATFEDLALLKARMWPGQTLVVNGAAISPQALSDEWGKPVRIGSSLAMYQTPARQWLDPMWENPPASVLAQQFWRDSKNGLPARTPAGRPWPRISVITVTLDQGEFIEQTIRSVLDQGYPNLEYIILDGGSKDATVSILKKYESRLTYWHSRPDNGQSSAINEGFEMATGEIVTWLNSDDWYEPGALFRVAATFDAHDTDMVIGACGVVEDSGTQHSNVHRSELPLGYVAKLPLDRLLDLDNCWQQGDFFYQPEVFFTRDIWDRAGGKVAEDLFYSMDYEMWIRFAGAGARFVQIPEVTTTYRKHDAQKTNSKELPFLPELREVNARYREQFKEALKDE